MTSSPDSLMELVHQQLIHQKMPVIYKQTFEFFLGKIVSLFLQKVVTFRLVEGISAENPTLPKDVDGALKLATFNLPPFTFNQKMWVYQDLKLKDLL